MNQGKHTIPMKDPKHDRAVFAILLRRNPDLELALHYKPLSSWTREHFEQVDDELLEEFIEFGRQKDDEPNQYGLFVEGLREKLRRANSDF